MINLKKVATMFFSIVFSLTLLFPNIVNAQELNGEWENLLKPEDSVEHVSYYKESDLVNNLALKNNNELKSLGFSDNDVQKLRTLQNNHEIEDMGAVLKVKSQVKMHAYSSIKKRTKFSMDYEWKWDKQPGFLMNDMIGFGWDSEMHLVEDKSPVYLKYSPRGNNNIQYKARVKKNLQNKDICYAYADIDMSKDSYFCYSGNGTIYLEQVGREANVGCSFAYGHQTIKLFSPSISTDGSGGFTFGSFVSQAWAKYKASELHP